jgi:tRNA (guanine10-N2)-dimethyltransferase
VAHSAIFLAIIAGFSTSPIAQAAGHLIADNTHTVDLESPENEIVVILAGPEDPSNHPDTVGSNSPIAIWGLREVRWKRESYASRTPSERPFFQPVSLDPRQARLLISLAHRQSIEPTTVVDPFCGTGGIAIEAALQGMEALASDLDPRMVEGTLQNLEWAGVSARAETCEAAVSAFNSTSRPSPDFQELRP